MSIASVNINVKEDVQMSFKQNFSRLELHTFFFWVAKFFFFFSIFKAKHGRNALLLQIRRKKVPFVRKRNPVKRKGGKKEKNFYF